MKYPQAHTELINEMKNYSSTQRGLQVAKALNLHYTKHFAGIMGSLTLMIENATGVPIEITALAKSTLKDAMEVEGLD